MNDRNTAQARVQNDSWQWVIAPYGAPDETSEVNAIPEFYTVAAQTVFAPPAPRAFQPFAESAPSLLAA